MSKSQLIIDNISIKKFSFAITKKEQENGLMYKLSPKVMVFPYLNSKIRKFWMKNTLLPLDIIFCSNNEIIDICYGQPLSEKLIGPNLPSSLVIETPYLFTKKNNIHIGSKVILKFDKSSLGKLIRCNGCYKNT